ncbi:winged helix-turn-helix transcriptional regulator [Mycobacterium interjectum]|uniref:winged helix-turn-helix transcriptional regulator n=1 Tax=Mycobacterium interjectum TaxID=33895 RepID=UPI0021F276BD|nr:helix-turn-helix domain-containing protein [Mycobacterium interjectum]
MALPREYPAESCPIARSLEIVGERWTLLILRDAFYGARRFSDLQRHLGIPKAVLSDRLGFLVEQGVLSKDSGEYRMTVKGKRLWPLLWSMITWGNDNYVEKPNRRTYRHADCGGMIGPDAGATDARRFPTSPTSSRTHRRDRASRAATIPSAGRSGGRTGCWSRSSPSAPATPWPGPPARPAGRGRS